MTREMIGQIERDYWAEKADPIDMSEIFDLAQKALEQEPILDKIRAELHATAEMHEDGDYYLRDEWIDEYFDKYKAESEA